MYHVMLSFQTLPRPWCIIFITMAFLVVHMPPAHAAALVNGGVVSGSISVPGEQDSYTFMANTGGAIRIRVVDTTNSDFAPTIKLYDPSGDLMGWATAAASSVAGREERATESGTYTVIVTGGSYGGSTTTGNYKLYFVYMPGANEGGLLPNGGVVAGTIDLGDLDSYTFTANAGESVEIRVADTSNNDFAPSITEQKGKPLVRPV